MLRYARALASSSERSLQQVKTRQALVMPADAYMHCCWLPCVLQGVEPQIRADIWPFLLEVFDHTSTYAQRQHQHYLMTSQYQQLLLQCQV